MTNFQDKVKALRAHHEELLSRKNIAEEWGNGIYTRYKNPILTAEHTPLEWRYDFNEKGQPVSRTAHNDERHVEQRSNKIQR